MPFVLAEHNTAGIINHYALDGSGTNIQADGHPTTSKGLAAILTRKVKRC
jgi:hypothetical protein